jgi:phosphoglycolate phosphatase-like HAD superfamily hydrolase
VLLVLWDLDHILLEVRDLGREAYAVGFERVTGVELTDMAVAAGRTDRAVIRDTLRLHGLLPVDELVERVGEAVGAEFTARSELIRRNGRALAGAADTLRELSGLADVHQSVLTGDMRPVALAKLSSFGLAEHLDLASGAFGMDHVERRRLVSLASGRAAETTGVAIQPEHTVVIADRPLDVRAARRGGARVIAVAAGGGNLDALRAAGASAVLDDLTDSARVLAAVRGAG